MTTKLRGYSFKAIPSTCYGKPAWQGRVRRRGWAPGYWITVQSDYGPIEYTSRDYALAGAHVWALQNEITLGAGATVPTQATHREMKASQ